IRTPAGPDRSQCPGAAGGRPAGPRQDRSSVAWTPSMTGSFTGPPGERSAAERIGRRVSAAQAAGSGGGGGFGSAFGTGTGAASRTRWLPQRAHDAEHRVRQALVAGDREMHAVRLPEQLLLSGSVRQVGRVAAPGG